MSRLALLGGSPVIPGSLKPYPSIGEAERRQVLEVVDSGCLSGFFGDWHHGFNGGPKVQELEAAWCEVFGCHHAVTVNSNTSGLYAAIGAVGIGPGDEVIVPPLSMSATAMAPLIYGGTPVFADLDPLTYCLDINAVRSSITDRTRAILAVNLMGHPAPLHELRALADEQGIYLVEDNAQGPLASENGKYCGTIGHIGVFSLNYHKHIHTGEGGVCVTDDERLDRRLRMIRNHAEAVAERAGETDLTNLVGFNFRMTELSAAVGLAQLEQAEDHIGRRQRVAESLTDAVTDLDGIDAPHVRPGCRHVYYLWYARYDESVIGVPRALFAEALQAEGFPALQGYLQPLYRLPLFRERIAIGSQGFPFNLTDRSYPDGLCPVAEQLFERDLLGVLTCTYDMTDEAIGLYAEALNKVHAHLGDLAPAARGRVGS